MDEYINGGSTKDSQMTYSDYLEYWMKEYFEINYKYSTAKRYKETFKVLKGEIGKYKLSYITPFLLNQSLLKIAQKCKTKEGLNSRIVATTKKFVIMPMVGPLVPGYLLIVPKDHYLSIAQLPKEQVEELKIIKEELKKVFKQYYGKSVFYEHGALSCSAKGGCCSGHAHLHIVAVDIDVKDEFSKYGYELRKLENYNEIINQKQRNTPYLYYENQNGEMFVADAPEVESQFIRKLIAKDINALDRALWNENIRKDWMIENDKLKVGTAASYRKYERSISKNIELDR